MDILLKIESKELTRCTHCLEITRAIAQYPNSLRKVCEPCASKKNSLILPKLYWDVYESMQSLKHNPNYIVLTAQKLEIGVGEARVIARHLRRKGLSVHYSRKEVIVNGKVLTDKQYQVLLAINSKEYLTRFDYIAKAAKDLGIGRETLVLRIKELKKLGFKILSSEERVENFRKYVLKQMLSTRKTRAEFIKSTVRATGFKQKIIGDIVSYYEKQGFTLRKGVLPEEILKIVSYHTSINLSELRDLFPTYDPKSVLIAAYKLKNKGLIEIKKYSRDKILISLIIPSEESLATKYPLLKFPHPLEAV